MMTFKEIVDLGSQYGFVAGEIAGSNFLTLRREGVRVELSFPNDNLSSILKENENTSWECRFVDEKTQMELFRDWFDIYGGTPEEKILDVKNQVLEFINKIGTLEFRIDEESAFSIWGLKFLKSRVLKFRTNGEWTKF